MENLLKKVVKIGSLGATITVIIVLQMIFAIPIPNAFDGIASVPLPWISIALIVIFLTLIFIALIYIKYTKAIEVKDDETQEE